MKNRRIINITIIVIILILLGLSGYLYYQLHTIKNNASPDINKENENLVNKVSKLYLTPINEKPTIATVSDPEALKKQAFFTLSEKGDKVLIFNNAGRAVLYRPSINKIIETVFIKNTLEY